MLVQRRQGRRSRRNEQRNSIPHLSCPYWPNRQTPPEHVYCVFDVDEHPNIPSAIETARANGMKIALSNPCFEYWLLLHFGPYGATNLTRHRAVQELGAKMGGYEKGKSYGNLWREGLDNAMQTAIDHHRAQWQIDPSDPKKILECCPSTGVHLLMKLLKELAEDKAQAAS